MINDIRVVFGPLMYEDKNLEGKTITEVKRISEVFLGIPARNPNIVILVTHKHVVDRFYILKSGETIEATLYVESCPGSGQSVQDVLASLKFSSQIVSGIFIASTRKRYRGDYKLKPGDTLEFVRIDN